MTNIAIIEDDPYFRKLLSSRLKKDLNVSVKSYHDHQHFLNNREKVELVIIDYNLENIDGLQAFRLISALQLAKSTVLISSNENLEEIIENSGVFPKHHLLKDNLIIQNLTKIWQEEFAKRPLRKLVQRVLS